MLNVALADNIYINIFLVADCALSNMSKAKTTSERGNQLLFYKKLLSMN